MAQSNTDIPQFNYKESRFENMNGFLKSVQFWKRKLTFGKQTVVKSVYWMD